MCSRILTLVHLFCLKRASADVIGSLLLIECQSFLEQVVTRDTVLQVNGAHPILLT